MVGAGSGGVVVEVATSARSTPLHAATTSSRPVAAARGRREAWRTVQLQ